ncbi:MAG TPA: poly(3-hydroxyalkanoate) depolymerase [Rubrobacter sp.]|nr:poly(3-hydroxyalkanoate) depolymerase [Rubrobacter sp.]
MSERDLTSEIEIRHVNVGGQLLRVGVRPRSASSGPTLLLLNGIGANIELADPFVDELVHEGIEVVNFDVPGVGGSPTPPMPYRLPGLARLAARMLDALGYDEVDVLGVSWGGALAQQFARQFPHRCRRLILASTGTGAIMVPGRPSVLVKLATPRRYLNPSRMEHIAPDLYGGKAGSDPEAVRKHTGAIKARGARGYYYQLLAGTGWTSLPWLRKLHQPTLVIHGSEDPIVPVVNARILARLIPDSRLHIVEDGHLALLTSAEELAPVVERFLLDKDDPGEGRAYG